MSRFAPAESNLQNHEHGLLPDERPLAPDER
jgi:hypothetical protein